MEQVFLIFIINMSHVVIGVVENMFISGELEDFYIGSIFVLNIVLNIEVNKCMI